MGPDGGSKVPDRGRPSRSDLSVDEKGLQKPKIPSVANGDWACGMCGNINWERREKCNICQGDKPGALKEERTGAAGGFKEFDEEDEKARKRKRDEEYELTKTRKATKQKCDVCKRASCLC